MRKFWLRLARVMPAVVVSAMLIAEPKAISAASPLWGPVTVCGTSLCRNGHPWQLFMATVYDGLDHPAATVARAVAAGINTISVTDFLDTDASPTTGSSDESRWVEVDDLIAAASAAHLLVELDLSTYRNLLQRAGVNPYAMDWRPFLAQVANRRNTVTGIRYGDDPAIALVAFAGQPEAIFGGSTHGVTAAGLIEFYRQVLAYWHTLAPHQLETTGGLYELDWKSGIPWREIFALPHNDVNAMHVYQAGDRSITLPMVSAFSAAHHKPWIVEQSGFGASLGDPARAAGFASDFDLARRYGAAGTGIWNLGTQTSNTYDVGPQFAKTFAVTVSHGRATALANARSLGDGS